MKINNIENQLDVIRIDLYNETKNLTFEQKKEREKKMMDKLAKEGFKFKYQKRDKDYVISQKTMLINEKTEDI